MENSGTEDGTPKGLINGVDREVGDGMAARLISHWMNLPNFFGNEILHEVRIAGRATRPGRWNLEIGPWRIILDGRSDHATAFAESPEKPTYVLTHVMEISRSDGLPFHHSEGAAFGEHLRVAFSFALGRWVAPILPAGLSPTGEVVWESWYPPICDPAATVGQGWLYYHSREDFECFLRAALSSLEQDGSNGSLRFQMACAVQASQAGFLEQRMMTSFAALENLSWVVLVLGERISRTQYKNSRNWPGDKRLRAIVDLARIPCDLAAYDVPSLTTFASMNDKADAPAALVEIRNRLVHPKSPRDDIYKLTIW